MLKLDGSVAFPSWGHNSQHPQPEGEIHFGSWFSAHLPVPKAEISLWRVTVEGKLLKSPWPASKREKEGAYAQKYLYISIPHQPVAHLQPTCTT